MEAILGFGIFIILILVGLFVGGANERRHLRKLDQRESLHRDMIVCQLKSFPFAGRGQQPPMMYTAEVVIATDYLKTFLAKLKNLFGGEVRSYQMLLERARREATVKILEQAKLSGYNAVCNIRLETADVGGNVGKQGVAMAAILASGTAYHATHRS